MKITSLIDKIIRVNIIKTIYLNLKYVHFKDVLKIPIIVFGKYKIKNVKGSLIFNCQLKPGILKLNRDEAVCLYNGARYKGCFNNAGTIIINGYTEIGTGTALNTTCSGKIIFGDLCHIGPNNVLYSDQYIEIGEKTRTSWFSQIYDTDFHYTVRSDGSVKRKTIPVVIGDNIWIGHHVTINKGSIIPSSSIISAHSLVNKNLTTISPQGGTFVGSPVHLIPQKIERLFETDIEYKIDDYFRNNTDVTEVNICQFTK